MAIEASIMRKWLVAGGLAVGVGIGAAGIANAATSTTTAPSAAPTTTAPSGQCHSNEDPAHEKTESPQREADENACRGPFGHRGNGSGFRHDETPVTGANAEAAKAAALKAVPGTVERVEQRSDGTYEVHVIKADGTEVHVLLDTSFKVIGQETGGPRGGWDHHHGPDSNGSPETNPNA
jgi:hypothetical protein